MIRRHKPTRRIFCLETLEHRLCPSSLPLGTPLSQPDAATQAHLSQAYDQLPLSFEANQGQVDPQVNFLSQGSGYTLFLTRTEAVLSLQQPASSQGSKGPATRGDVLRMQLVGANPAPAVAGLDEQVGKTNYFMSSDPAQWHVGIANYGKVQYQDVYPGVDLIYYGNQQQLEYDFRVAAGADPKAIRLTFQGAAGMDLDSEGNLVLHTAGDDVIEHAPILYQKCNGVRQAVSGHYVLEGNSQVGFQVGAYDPTRQLVIDPVYSLVYSTYLGGNKGNTVGYGIAVDGAGDAYVTGTTKSKYFPTTSGAFQRSGTFGANVFYTTFVTKFNAAGSALVYSTFVGSAIPSGIAVDAAGDAYITGYTPAAGFPTKNPLQATNGGGTSPSGFTGDAFVTKLNPTGSALVYSTFLGGSGADRANGIAVDGSGDAYVIGYTESTNFPTTPGSLQPVMGAGSGFVAELNPIGSALVYSTYLGSNATINGEGIAVDGAGNAYVTGFMVGNPDVWNAFVAKLNSTGSAFVYFYSLAGSQGFHIAVDGSGNAYVTGVAASDLPTTVGAFQTTSGGGPDAFVTEVNATGSALLYSTFLGGSGEEDGWGGNFPPGGIALDSAGNIYVTGNTWGINSPATDNFPTKNALQATYGGGQIDTFVAEINPSQTGAASLVYSTYLGGSDQDVSYGIAVDGSGNAYVTGFTFSANFPTRNAFQPQINPPTGPHGQIADAFVTKIDPPPDAGSASVRGLAAEERSKTRPPGGPLPASLDGPGVAFVATGAIARSVPGSARDADVALVAMPTHETMLPGNPFARARLAESLAPSESSFACAAPRERADGPSLGAHLGHRLKATVVAIEATDACFGPGEWLPDVLVSDHSLVTIG